MLTLQRRSQRECCVHIAALFTERPLCSHCSVVHREKRQTAEFCEDFLKRFGSRVDPSMLQINERNMFIHCVYIFNENVKIVREQDVLSVHAQDTSTTGSGLCSCANSRNLASTCLISFKIPASFFSFVFFYFVILMNVVLRHIKEYKP